MPERLAGKVAFVTGAARGQGRGQAVRLAAEGADIIAIDLCTKPETTSYPGSTQEDLAETGRLVKELGRRIVTRVADIRALAELEAAVAEGVAELGRLDVVVANAGICTTAMSWEITPEQWKETIDVNLTGAFHTAKATVPRLIEQGSGGSVIFISSVAGLRANPFLAHYVASKHGVTGLAKTMALELGRYDIRVNSVHPGAVESGMYPAELVPLLQEYATTLAPIFMPTLPDQISQPEDIASAVAWLASAEARHVTGIQLPVDLGNLLH
nr:mycofactocin-coupled SDR family oxidoreductase [Amycolatopsis jejuensis]